MELDSTLTQAQWGLLQCSNLYLRYVTTEGGSSSKKGGVAVDPFQSEVAHALLEHAATALQQMYCQYFKPRQKDCTTVSILHAHS